MNGNKGLKLLMTADPVSDAWAYSLDLTRSLQPSQVNVTLAITGGFLKIDQAKEAAKLDNLDIIESNYRSEWLHSAWKHDDMEKAGEWLLELEELYWPDVIHLNSYAYGSLPWQTPVLVSCQYCPFSRWKNINNGSSLNESYLGRVRSGIKAADMVIAPGWQLLQNLESQFGFFPNKQVIPPFREKTAFYLSEKEAFVFSIFPFGTPKKDKSWYESVSSQLKVPLFIAGEEKPPFVVGSDIRNIYFLGDLDVKHLSYWMTRADIYASPFYHRGFAAHLMDAAHSGCALIAGEAPCTREQWKDAVQYISPDDPVDFANTCNRLIGDEALRKELVKKAIQKTEENAPENMAKAYFNLYKQLGIPAVMHTPEKNAAI